MNIFNKFKKNDFLQKKYIVPSVVILFFLIFFVVVLNFFLSVEDYWLCKNGEWIKQGNPNAPRPEEYCIGDEVVSEKPSNNLDIEQKDEYGCLLAAGYSYDNEIGVCARSWELNTVDKYEAAKVATKFLSQNENIYGVLISEIQSNPCFGCFKVVFLKEEKKYNVILVNWEPFMQKEDSKITNFTECVSAGNPIMETYPRQCRSGEDIYTEYIGDVLEKQDLIKLNYPQPNAIIESPLKIEGQARGFWFFEATFPVVLVNWDGLIIAEGYAQADGEWMTEDFVNFKAELNFKKPEYKDNGALILQKSNPSDLPQNDNALEIPIYFK